MDCQIEAAPPALEPIAPADRLRIRVARGFRKLTGMVALVRESLAPAAVPAPSAEEAVAFAPLGLKAGERVRVKPRQQIAATLDAQGRYRGLAYVPAMDRYCGREFSVRKRVNLFFDERTRTQLKVQDVVILDGSFCEPGLAEPSAFAGCERTCFLFWKEAWLERVDDA